ncbi:MAG TPA: MerR family transcriptional regulator [Ktedonobacterales bacterium]|nr:MerR family transcriptional regulator [Ktedonobacterales bacterium]
MEELTISEVARRAGIRPSAIRYYESSGVLPTPRRASGRRRYDASIVQRLAVVQLAQEAGFTIAEIKSLFSNFAPETPAWERWQPLATRKLTEVEALIIRAQKMKRLLEVCLLECRCLTMEECARVISQRQNAEPDSR